jgi:hypothetical protein
MKISINILAGLFGRMQDLALRRRVVRLNRALYRPVKSIPREELHGIWEDLHRWEEEVDHVLTAYLKSVDQAKNPTAPGPLKWGPYWRIFVDVFIKRLNIYTQTRQLLQDSLIKEIYPPQGKSSQILTSYYHRSVYKGYIQFL